MIFDANLLFFHHQEVTGTEAIVSRALDLGSAEGAAGAGGTAGAGNALALVVLADGCEAGSVELELRCADTLDAAGALAEPQLAAMYPLPEERRKDGAPALAAPLPRPLRRYVALALTPKDGAQGRLTAGLVLA